MPSKAPALSTNMIHGGIVNIRDATLNMPIHQVNEHANRETALNLLRSNCSLAALVDASQRYDPPRCAEATRQHIIRKLEGWIHHDHDHDHNPPSSIFWLFGGAGAGKSALAQTLADKFKTNEGLAASFFFFKTNVNRNDGNRLIPTLALQLGRSFQGLAPIIEDMILGNPDLFKSSRQTQMLELLVAPLIRLSLAETDGEPVHPNTALKSHPRLVVIDGLDECIDSTIQCDLLRIIASAIPHFPYPLRFLITSRPESHITRVFLHDVGEVAQYDLSIDSDADEDIRIFLNAEFAKIRRTHPLSHHLPSHWPHPADIIPIVERSSAHFIYASTAIRFIQSPKHRPDDRLQVILGLKQPYGKERPYALLDALYKLIFLEIQDSSQLEQIQRALGIIHLRTLKTGLFGWEQWRSERHVIEELLELRPGDLVLLFDPLLSLVTFDHDNIRIFHKSLFDYLLDSDRSEDFRLDLGLAHEAAANHIVRFKKLKDSWYSSEFQDFAYHCQFARLNDRWTDHVRSLARDPKITVQSEVFESSRSLLLQSMLYFLQVIGRQEFDSNGYFYREYVKKKNQYLRPPVALRQRVKYWWMDLSLISQLKSFERNLRLTLRDYFQRIDLNKLDLTGFDGRAIPVVNTSVAKSIEREHEMFSSYVKTHNRFLNIVASFVEKSSGLIHSCHYVFQDVSFIPPFSVVFLLLVTYTEDGLRLSCSKFGDLQPIRFVQETRVHHLVEKHFQNTQIEVKNNYMKLLRTSY